MTIYYDVNTCLDSIWLRPILNPCNHVYTIYRPINLPNIVESHAYFSKDKNHVRYGIVPDANPKVNLDMNGNFGFHIFGNPQAQTWFSDAIEASILGKSHPALIR